MRQRLRRLMSSDYNLVFCLCVCLLFGLTYNAWLAFDLNYSVDPKTYWGLAHFDFNQSVVRKYRVLEPFTVAGMNWLLVHAVRLIKPDALNGDYSMRLCFYIFNLASSSALCTLVFAYIRSLGRSRLAALVGAMVMVCSIWTSNNTWAFMTDSLFTCFIVLTLIAIEKPPSAKVLFWCIILAPFTKESYLFILPVIFFFSKVPKLKLILWFSLSAVITFSFRYLYDYLTGHPMSESLNQDTEHFTYILNNSKRFFIPEFSEPFKGTLGLWLLVPIGGMLLMKGFAGKLFRQIKPYMILWLLLVVMQMLMSGDLARMFYLYMPIIAFVVAFTVDEWRNDIENKKGSVSGTL